MLKIAICEDNKDLLEIIAEVVDNIISDNNLVAEVVFTTNNYNDMEKFIETNEADLYLLDVDLKSGVANKDGVLLARNIKKYKDKIILFITGSPINMNKIFEVKAYNCLTKPVNIAYLEVLILTIYKEYNSNNQGDKFINVDCIDNKTYCINCSNIIHIDKVNDICIINLKSGEQVLTTLTLQHINDICSNLDRVHKSFLCNADYIYSINHKQKEITMTNGNIIYLGGRYKDKFYQKTNL